MPPSGVPAAMAKKCTSGVTAAFSSDDISSDEDSVSLKILQQLKHMNSRLEVVEEQVAEVKVSKRQKRCRTAELSKLSSSNVKSVTVKNSEKTVNVSSNESESELDTGNNLPNLATWRSSVEIQRKVDSRLRQLEQLQQESGNDSSSKIKSK